VAFLTATGASSAYFLSYLSGGRDLLNKYANDRMKEFEKVITDQSRLQLFIFMTSIRLFPFSPNWFINYASSVVGVPIYIFFPSVVLGLLPFHYVTVNSGTILSEIKSTSDIYDPKVVILLIILSLFFIIPILFKKKLQKYFKIE
jgi:uncharacterized membrane protein YdjX (TVP38/TMEM64 family)